MLTDLILAIYMVVCGVPQLLTCNHVILFQFLVTNHFNEFHTHGQLVTKLLNELLDLKKQ